MIWNRKKRRAELERVNRVPIQSGFSPRWVPTLCDVDVYVDPDCPPGSIYILPNTEFPTQVRVSRWPYSDNLALHSAILKLTWNATRIQEALYEKSAFLDQLEVHVKQRSTP